ncbi:hypothetical protein U3516DRAFT_616068 [Neocallimastix sp. 'constans']|jgi:hypothetical protein
MASAIKNNIFPTISKNHIKDTHILYNQLVKNAMKYQSSMLALATAINELSSSYDAFMKYAPMKAIIESSGQQNDIYNSLKIYRILYESFKKMSEFLNRDFALALNEDFKSMQVKFNDKKIEKTLKLEEKQRTKSMIPGVIPEPSNIQRGLFQQYISAVKFVTRKTRKLQNYEIHVFQRMVQGILSFEDPGNSSFINQSISRDLEETPRLGYQGINKKSILDVSHIDNGMFNESILKGTNYDKNPLTNSYIREEVAKNEMNGDGKYFQYSNHSPVSSNDNFGKEIYDNEMNADVNTNQGTSSDYSKHDYRQQRYTSTPNLYEMKYFSNKYEEKNAAAQPVNNEGFSYRSRSKSLSASQNVYENYKKGHYSMPATSKNNRFSTPASSTNPLVAATPKLDENNRKSVDPYFNGRNNGRINSVNSHTSSSSGRSNLSQTHNIITNNNNNEPTASKNDIDKVKEEENEEADTTITENNIKKDTISKLVKKTSFKKNFSEMKQKLHKRRSASNSPATKPVSILKKRSATFSNGSSSSSTQNDNTVKNDNLAKLQNIMSKEEESDDEEFIVISKKKMDSLIRTGKVHSIEDIFRKNKTESIASNDSDNKSKPSSTPGTASTTNNGNYPLDDLIASPEDSREKEVQSNNKTNIPNGLIEETPDLANEATPRLSENSAKHLSRQGRNDIYGGLVQSHIRGMQSNIASKSHSIIPSGYATPMLAHQEPTYSHSKLSKVNFPLEYATPMLSRYNNMNNYSPMLESDVPSVNYNEDITPPRSQKAKSAVNLQNLLNNWPSVEALTKSKESTPEFSKRKNSLPNFSKRQSSLDNPDRDKTPIFSERKNSLPNFTKRQNSLDNPPTVTEKASSKPNLKITKAEEIEVNNNNNNNNNAQKKKEVNWDNNNKEYIIPNNSVSIRSTDESYYDDIINVTYATDNEESSMMINNPTRLIFSKFNNSGNLSGITEGESTLQTPTDAIPTDTLVVPNKKDKRLNGLRNIITQDVLNDELPPTPVSPTLTKKPYEPSKPVRGESLHFKPKLSIEIQIQPPESEKSEKTEKLENSEKAEPEKTKEEREEEIINNLHVAENENGLFTPIVKIGNDEDEILTPIEKVNDDENDDGLLTPIEKIKDSDETEDDIKLVDIPRYNKRILSLKMNDQPLDNNEASELASPCPTTYVLDKIKEIEDKNKEKNDDDNGLNYNSEEDLDILRFISYRKAPEALEKHLIENEQQEQQLQEIQQQQQQEEEVQQEMKAKNDYIFNAGNEQPKNPFNYAEDEGNDTENPELSDVESEIIDINDLELPKKNDRKDSVKSVISNISSKFSQKLNSMFSNSESTTAVNNSENDAKVNGNDEATEQKIDNHQGQDGNEEGIMNETETETENETEIEIETTFDESAFQENIKEQKEELEKSKGVFSFARKLSSDFIKGSGELIRRSSKESLKSLTRKFSQRGDAESDHQEIITTEKPEEMENLKKSNSLNYEFPRRKSSASLKNYHQKNDGEEAPLNDDRSIKTVNTINSASLPRKDSLIRSESIKKQASVRSVVTVATTSSNLTSTPIMHTIEDSEVESLFDETPKIEDFPERPQRNNIPSRPDTPNAPNTPVFPNIKLCNILMNHEESSVLNFNDQEDVIVISNPLLEVTNNKNLAEYKNDLPDEHHEFRISRNEAYMTFNLCQNDIDIKSVMGSIVDPDEDSIRMDMLNNESSLSFRSINPNSVYEENNSVILTAPKLTNKSKSKKPELHIDTLANTSKVVAIIPSPIPQKDNNFAQRFNNLNAASLVHETREQQSIKTNHNNNNSLKKYVALYPYNARDERELSFQRADVINVRKEQGEWVYGYRESEEGEEIKYGWVPKSYLKVITLN